jgi:hypothetical protein
MDRKESTATLSKRQHTTIPGHEEILIRRQEERWENNKKDDELRSFSLKETENNIPHDGYQIDYTTKENSKLQTLLRDRGLSLTGTRED